MSWLEERVNNKELMASDVREKENVYFQFLAIVWILRRHARLNCY